MDRVTISIQSELQHLALMLIDMWAPRHLRPLSNSLLKVSFINHPFHWGTLHTSTLRLGFNRTINLLYINDAMHAIVLKLPIPLASISHSFAIISTLIYHSSL